MQAVILAAGRGLRMREQTELTPKPLLTVRGRTLLEYKLDSLPPAITETVLIVGYLSGKIYQYLGTEYNGMPLRYVEQPELLGTADALWRAQDVLGERFIVMMGDDIYSPEDLKECAEQNLSIVIHPVNEPRSGGRIVFDENGKIKDIQEKSNSDREPGYLNTGLYSITREIFSYPQIKLPGKEEWGLPQTLLQMADEHDITPITSRFWLPLTTPEDLQTAEEFLSETDQIVPA